MEHKEDKKKGFNISDDCEEIDNIVSESEAIYRTQQMEDFEVPQEWLDEANERSKRLRSGEDKGYTHEEIMKMAYEHLAIFKKSRANV